MLFLSSGALRYFAIRSSTLGKNASSCSWKKATREARSATRNAALTKQSSRRELWGSGDDGLLLTLLRKTERDEADDNNSEDRELTGEEHEGTTS